MRRKAPMDLIVLYKKKMDLIDTEEEATETRTWEEGE
jgi:hypothetical protein